MTYDYIFWSNGSFAVKLNLMVDQHKPECPVKILDGCGHTHDEPSRFQLMFVWNISWTAKAFVTTLGMAIHHHKLECHGNRPGCCPQGQGHIKAYIIKILQVGGGGGVHFSARQQTLLVWAEASFVETPCDFCLGCECMDDSTGRAVLIII